jgi:tRNA A37 threonylcarbamoyladenosine biosynthesis protein TsaE
MMQELSFLYTIDDIARAASWLLNHTDGRRVWLMTGDMGAGKTTLDQKL